MSETISGGEFSDDIVGFETLGRDGDGAGLSTEETGEADDSEGGGESEDSFSKSAP